MSGVSIDHLASVVILLAAVLLFIGLFSQTLSATVGYQRNTSTAKECSGLLDAILLTPGIPTSGAPAMFGLQDAESAQYNLNSFSLMRLNSLSGTPLSYQKTNLTYDSIKTNPSNYMSYPYSDMVNYSTALALLGINQTFGFQFTLTPVVNISIVEVSANPLNLSLSVTGTGSPLSNANVNYLLVPVSLNSNYPSFTSTTNEAGTVQTNSLGSASINFPNFFPNQDLTYAFVAYAYLDGITGVGYYEHPADVNQSIVPLINPLSTLNVTLANSDDIPTTSAHASTLYYNSTFILESENYAIQQTSLASSTPSGTVTSGAGNPYASISMGSLTPGILVIAYNYAGNCGVVMIPWGLGSLGFPMTFGGTSNNQAWVATDFRQVEINGVSYQAELSLWNLQGYQVIGK